MILDPETGFGRKALHRLEDEQVIWLTTIAANGTPQPDPVWFFGESNSFLVYTKPNKFRGG
jgi:predicted pyridoxine 5'-phosphate oxidase superfamily flavin-nucleotide-binding protein